VIIERKRGLWVTGVVVAAILTMSGCGSGDPAPNPSPTASETLTPPTFPPPVPSAQSASDAFLAWVEASRAPDVETACAGLSPELAARMIDELNAGGAVTVQTCEEMIAAAAELYRATGQSADVDISVQEETDTDATLFVTYLATGDCGTVVMNRASGGWIITDQSQECLG